MEKGFWTSLKKPIIGLAPMDGVTDAPFRFIAAKYGNPDLIISEFTSVEGIAHGAAKTLKAFLYDEIERPVLAQVFGVTPENFYKSAFVVAEMGFDGLDINMGCPAKNVSSRGAGAALIRTPDLARQIVRACWDGMKDWSKGKKIEEVGLHEDILNFVKSAKKFEPERKLLPVSVKTRIGYDSVVVEDWVKNLLEEKPVNISLHGRTLKQMYTGTADWEAIARAAEIIRQTDTTVIGNGDISSLEDAKKRIKDYGVDGAMIGRAAFGNPWIFKGKNLEDVSLDERFRIAQEHAQLYEKVFENNHFVAMRKHLAWYCKGFHGAGIVRKRLMQTSTAQEVSETLMDLSPLSG